MTKLLCFSYPNFLGGIFIEGLTCMEICRMADPEKESFVLEFLFRMVICALYLFFFALTLNFLQNPVLDH